MILGVLSIWIVAAVLAGVIANNKNRSAGGWVVSTLFLTPLMVLILLALPSLTKEEKVWSQVSVVRCPDCLKYQDAPSPAKNKKCPFCAEEIKTEAVVCKHCGKDVPEYKAPEVFACKFCNKEIPIPQISES